MKAGVTLKGAGREDTILKQTVEGVSGLKIYAADGELSAAAVENLTLTGVYGKNSSSSNEPGVWMAGGRMSYCIVSNNVAPTLYSYYGAGIHIAGENVKIDHSLILKNKHTLRGNGGGICVGSKLTTKPVIDTCLIADNGSPSANPQGAGAGIYCSSPTILVNCTIAGNLTSHTENTRKDGGGAYFNATCYVTNCILSGNQALNGIEDGKPNWGGTTPVGSNNFFGDGSATFGDNVHSGVTVSFNDAANGDYTLKATSGAVGNGFWYDGISEDLEGTARTSPADIGCYVYDASKEPFSCPAVMLATEAFVDQPVGFEATVVNPPAGAELHYEWTLTNQFDGVVTLSSDSASPTETIPSAGFYTVALKVTDSVSGQSAVSAAEGTLHIAVRTNYVTSVSGATAVYPYDTPAKAATCFNTALAETIDGSTIIVDAGEHQLTDTVDLAEGVKVLGAGESRTILKAKASSRAIHMHHVDALVQDLAVTGGATAPGSGVFIDGTGGTVRRCRLYGNTSRQQNGSGDALQLGSTGALVENCIITNNSGTIIGGGDSSIIEVGSGILRNSLIAGNYCNYKNETEKIDCAVVGVGSAGTVENCTIVDSTIIGKSTQSVALQLENGATVRNTIVASNVVANSTQEQTDYISIPNWSSKTASSALTTVSNCAIGDGCSTLGKNPVDGAKIAFVDSANKDWRIKTASSCRGKGINSDWMTTAVDVAGEPRIKGRKVDIGCYEADLPGTVIIFR